MIKNARVEFPYTYVTASALSCGGTTFQITAMRYTCMLPKIVHAVRAVQVLLHRSLRSSMQTLSVHRNERRK